MSPVPTLDGEAIAMREFARRDGCDPKLVRNAVKYGRLPKRPDGLIPAALVGTGWRQTNRKRGGRGDQMSTVPTFGPVSAEVDAMAGSIADVPFLAACRLLPLLPREVLEPVLEALRGDVWRIVCGSLDDEAQPPAGCRGWADHPALNSAPMSDEDWRVAALDLGAADA